MIGNPPYQDETLGDNKGFAPPVYDKFLTEGYKVGTRVMMIHPARFLFNAGTTPKAWNIKENEYTITLSVGQLTTGVTIPEWTAVLMLSSIRSPALYMQAAFRAQNPCTFYRNSQYFRKENAYVFDFDPAHTLTIYEQFANT